jgi:hypothetical protein
MNKKTLLILVIAFVVLFVAGFFIFQYTDKIESVQGNPAGSQETESSPANNETGSEKIEEATKPTGSLLICADKCGDGICQISNENCGEIDCICLETPQDCPQDCK